MAPGIIDSHIHLWPADTANEQGHAWMAPGMPLAKPQLLSDYDEATKASGNSCNSSFLPIEGAIYVETDVRYSNPTSEAEERDVQIWAEGPLSEIAFLRSLIDHALASPTTPGLLALVPWAPLHLSPATLAEYLLLAEQRAGAATWARTKGFRFLLQALTDQNDFDKLVNGDNFFTNLCLLGSKGFSFDIGVDQRSAGTWQVEGIARVVERLRTRSTNPGGNAEYDVVLIFNHLCKPDFGSARTEEKDSFERWSRALTSIARYEKAYMKLSGAFSELPEHVLEKSTPADLAVYLRPWIAQVLQAFGPKRIMFGSDWPVCNLRGTAGDASWGLWREVVRCILDDPVHGLSEKGKLCIWRDTAAQAYRLE